MGRRRWRCWCLGSCGFRMIVWNVDGASGQTWTHIGCFRRGSVGGGGACHAGELKIGEKRVAEGVYEGIGVNLLREVARSGSVTTLINQRKGVSIEWNAYVSSRLW